jgi:hypothetical protein
MIIHIILGGTVDSEVWSLIRSYFFCNKYAIAAKGNINNEKIDHVIFNAPILHRTRKMIQFELFAVECDRFGWFVGGDQGHVFERNK